MKKISLKINGIMCDKCRQTIKNAISNLNNIKDDIGFETSIENFKS